MDKAPTIPSDKIRFELIAIMIRDVIIAKPMSEILKFFEYRTPLMSEILKFFEYRTPLKIRLYKVYINNPNKKDIESVIPISSNEISVLKFASISALITSDQLTELVLSDCILLILP